jgi:hypothetical protein
LFNPSLSDVLLLCLYFLNLFSSLQLQFLREMTLVSHAHHRSILGCLTFAASLEVGFPSRFPRLQLLRGRGQREQLQLHATPCGFARALASGFAAAAAAPALDGGGGSVRGSVLVATLSLRPFAAAHHFAGFAHAGQRRPACATSHHAATAVAAAVAAAVAPPEQ